MNARPASWAPLIVVGLLAALTFWLDRVVRITPWVDTRGFAHDPDYIVENFKAMAFDRQGRPWHQLAAARMTHYMDDDTTRLDRPVYTQYSSERQTVTVHSQRALVTPDGSHVYFLDDVRMERAADAGRAPMALSTEFLQVTPNAHRIQTDRGVTVRQAGSSIQAGAMLAEGEEPVVRFSQKVKSVYERSR